jgi:putative MATE family efflux protein
MNKENERLLREYDVKKLLIKLSIPAFVGMAINALYNFVDALFVARAEGELAIGGLALAFPIQMIVMAVGLMIGIGAASVFSRAFGRSDYRKMEDAVNTALRIDIVLAALFSVLSYVFINELLVFFGATAENINFAYDYLSIILIGLIPQSLSMVLNNLTRAEGRSKVAMYSLAISAGMNIILDPIFIFDFGFGLGVRGAAIATVISQFIGLTYIFISALSKHSNLKIKLDRWLHIDFVTIKEIVVVGFPTFLRNSLGAFLAIIIYRLINRYGGDEPGIYISIYGVINRIINFVFLPSFGVVQGMVPIVGFNYGAKNYKRMRDTIIFATKVIMIYFVIGFLFIQLFAPTLFSIFSEENIPTFIDYGAYAFRIISIGFLMVGFQIIVGAVFQALGYPIRAMIITLSRQVVFFIPLVYLFTYLFDDMLGIWVGFAVADILSGLISLVLLIIEMRYIHKLSEATPELVLST